MWSKIPQEMKSLKQWVCWAGDKLPKNAYTGKNAQSNNPDTWSDFNTAVRAVEKYKFDGIGFMFANGYFGVDLDNSTPELNKEFATTLQSYTEYSKSGKGIHIICKGVLPDGRRRKGNIEMYDGGRYFIMTGNKIGKWALNDCTETIKGLHSKYLADDTPRSVMPVNTTPQKTLNLSDDEVLQKGRESKSGTLFQLLYSGNWETLYPSQSDADLAFCNMLAFWTGKNREQMDRIFRSSHLMRPKWDGLRGGITYGDMTLTKAITNTQSFYGEEATDGGYKILNKYGVVNKETSKKSYALNDTGNAERLVAKYGNNLKYNHENKVWFIWNGRVWLVDNTNEIKRLADNIIRDMKVEAFAEKDADRQKELLKNVNRVSSSRGKEAMIKEATHLPNIPCLNSDFDRDEDLLNTASGILKLSTGEIIPHNPDFFLSKYTDYQMDKNPPKRWLQFLDEILSGDAELIRFIQKAVGYSMTGSVEEQVAFFCYGTGNNGKTLFLNIISKMLGSYGLATQPETILLKGGYTGGANSDVARLKGARFVTSVEPNEGVRLNEGLVKQLTGGDRVIARFLYGKEFEFEPEFKLWLATNHKPVIRGTDDGIWRRLRLIPFLKKIPPHQVDKRLFEKLEKEIPQILNWAFEGLKLWKAEGLGVPSAVIDATQEYRNEMDVVNNFLESCSMEIDGYKEKASNIFQRYVSWAKTNNEYEMSNTKFGAELSKRYDRKRLSDGIYYFGVKLVEDGELPEEKYTIGRTVKNVN